MKKLMKHLFTALFSLFSLAIQAQVQITAEQDQERNLTLFAFNNNVIPYTIQIQFAELKNLESLEGELLYKVAKPGKSTLVKLQSIYSNVQVGFRYNTKLYKGDFQSVNSFDSPYGIPVERGKAVSMRPLLANQKVPDDRRYTGVVFFFEQAATVSAPRKGIISEIKMDVEKVPEGPVDFSSENYIEIYHQDGSFTRLSGLKANSAKVAVGETVIPGQALAESSPQSNSSQHHVKMIQSRWEMDINGMNWVNFPVMILSEKEEILSDKVSENLQSVHPEELIAKELDKKELKKYLGK
jgi:murein DD-endopeptidase MepM/ murein hydrolase activator NlpD